MENPQRAGVFWESRVLHLILIVLVGLIAYSNTFDAPFHFDDVPRIVENPLIKDLSYFIDTNKAKQIDSDRLFQSRIVGFFTFALNYKINGLDVRGYHIFNISVHLISAILVYLLVALSFRTPVLRDSESSAQNRLIALFASLLFVSHPIQTQAVTYIIQRFTSLATMFYLASLVLYIKSRLSENRKRAISLYALSILSAILAMKTKEIAFTLPFIIVLYEFMFFTGAIKKRLLRLFPILITLIVVPLSLLDFQKPIGELLGDSGDLTRLQTSMSRWDYIFTQFRVISTYIRLLFLPVNQNLDYDYPVFYSFFTPEVFLSFLFLVSISGFGIYLLRFRNYRLVSFGIFWFFITLSVESSVIPIVDLIFEHRLYLPSPGLMTAFAFGIIVLFERLNARGYAVALLSIIAIVFASTAYARNSVWQSQISLWEDTLSKSPLNSRVHANLGYAYFWGGAYDKAVGELELASNLFKDDKHLFYILGSAYEKKMQTAKAVESYEKALKINPDFAEANNALGIVYANLKMTDKAIELYKRAIKTKPYFAEAHNNLGSALRSRGQIANAVGSYRQAIKLNPSYADAHFNLGLLYLENGRPDLARIEFSSALKSNPYHAMASQFIKYIDVKTQKK